MSGLEIMGAYLLGLLMGGILGFMVGRRLCRHVMRTSRIARLSGRRNHGFMKFFRRSVPTAEGSGTSRQTGERPAAHGATADATALRSRGEPSDGSAEEQRDEAPLTVPISQPRRKAHWFARWKRRRTIEAEEFIVRDSTGLRRAKFGMSLDGWVRLRLFDESGGRCATLGVSPDGNVRLRFYDQTGTPRVALRVLDEGQGDVSILDQDEKVVWQAP